MFTFLSAQSIIYCQGQNKKKTCSCQDTSVSLCFEKSDCGENSNDPYFDSLSCMLWWTQESGNKITGHDWYLLIWRILMDPVAWG